MVQVALGIGSNEGNRERCLEKAREDISERMGKIIKVSRIVESEAWGYESNSKFLNQALLIEANQDPHQLLNIIHQIEEGFGRHRKGYYTDREIDIDILLVEGAHVNTDELNIPHPHLSKRLFVLMPLAEIAGTWVHPGLNRTIEGLLDECPDNSQCNWYK